MPDRYIIQVEVNGDLVWFGKDSGASFETEAEAQTAANIVAAATNRMTIVTTTEGTTC